MNKLVDLEKELDVMNARNKILASNVEQKELHLNYMNIELENKTKELEKSKKRNEEL